MNRIKLLFLTLALGGSSLALAHHVPSAPSISACPECGPIPPLCNPQDQHCPDSGSE